MRAALTLFVAVLGACAGSPTPPPTTQQTPISASSASASIPTTARLTVTTSGGNVTTTPAGIDCRSEAPPWTSTGTCAADFPAGTVVTFHWVPTMAAGFGSFSVGEPGRDPAPCSADPGAPCVVTMDGDRHVSAAAVTIPPPPGGTPRK
ncbi:MAG: hypothetical protein ACHREM_20680 [Polyangiales bacterium]